MARPSEYDEHLLQAVAQLRVWRRKVEERPISLGGKPAKLVRVEGTVLWLSTDELERQLTPRFLEGAYKKVVATAQLSDLIAGREVQEPQKVIWRLQKDYQGRRRKDLERKAQRRLDQGGQWAVLLQPGSGYSASFRQQAREKRTVPAKKLGKTP
jgi:hypothetical protein